MITNWSEVANASVVRNIQSNKYYIVDRHPQYTVLVHGKEKLRDPDPTQFEWIPAFPISNWDDVSNGDLVVCRIDPERGITSDVVDWRDDRYLAGESEMWPISQFNPKDWSVIADALRIL